MITTIHRPHPSLRCLLADEAAFIDAAFHCILPEARDEGLQVSASAYVDAKLAALLVQDSAESDIDLRFYRAGIAEVQAFCERTQGRRFQALSLWQQLSVLAQIDRPGDAPSSLRRCLLDLLLNDAAEAYFDVVGPSWAEAHDALRAAAA
jgi:hypothetical protein